jgi:TRAP-type C4-dicarboxylate transport system permease small subunit
MSTLFLSMMLGVILLQVYGRFTKLSFLPWTEEVAKYLMVWMALLAAFVALTKNAHIGIDTLRNKLPIRLKPFVTLSARAIIMFFVTFTLIVGWKLALRAKLQTAATLDLSMFWILVSIPVCCFLMALETFLKLVNDIYKICKGH